MLTRQTATRTVTIHADKADGVVSLARLSGRMPTTVNTATSAAGGDHAVAEVEEAAPAPATWTNRHVQMIGGYTNP